MDYGCSEQRQKGLAHQKMRLLDQHRLQFSTPGALQTNDMLTKNQITAAELYLMAKEKEGINFGNLKP